MDWKKGLAVGVIGLLVGGFAMGTWDAFHPNEVLTEIIVEVDKEIPASYLVIGEVPYTIEDISDLLKQIGEFEVEYNFDDKLADAYAEAEEFLKDELNEYRGEEYEIDEMEIDFKDKYSYKELKDGDYVFTFKGEIIYDDDEGERDFEVKIKYDFSKDRYRNDML